MNSSANLIMVIGVAMVLGLAGCASVSRSMPVAYASDCPDGTSLDMAEGLDGILTSSYPPTSPGDGSGSCPRDGSTPDEQETHDYVSARWDLF